MARHTWGVDPLSSTRPRAVRCWRHGYPTDDRDSRCVRQCERCWLTLVGSDVLRDLELHELLSHRRTPSVRVKAYVKTPHTVGLNSAEPAT
jgi:hypothetical protein